MANRAPHRVPEQPDVGRIAGVGLDAEGVNPPAQRLARLFSGHPVPRLDHQSAYPAQQLRTQQGHVVDHRLQPVFRTAVPVPQHLANQTVVIGNVHQTVEVAVQALLENRQHQHAPQVHARTPRVPAHPGAGFRLEQGKQPTAKHRVGMQVLQAQQQRRDVVPGLRVNHQVLDEGAADFQLCRLGLSHALFPKILQQWSRTGRFSPDLPKTSRTCRIFDSRNDTVPPCTCLFVLDNCVTIRLFWQALNSEAFSDLSLSQIVSWMEIADFKTCEIEGYIIVFISFYGGELILMAT